MGRQKYYAVRRGRTTGLFYSWDKCKEQIHLWRGAEYKSFSNKESALSWLNYEIKPEQAAELAAKTAQLFSTADPNAPADNPATETTAETTGDGQAAPTGEKKPKAIYAIYTDGSCLKNPGGPGGWAAIVVEKGASRLEISGGAPETTNNRMELTAAIRGIARTRYRSEIYLYTDSQYLRNAVDKNWLKKWKKNGWKTSTGGEVKNQDLWQELEKVMKKRTINFNWILGHAGHPENERCDQMAKKAARSQRTLPRSPEPD